MICFQDYVRHLLFNVLSIYIELLIFDGILQKPITGIR